MPRVVRQTFIARTRETQKILLGVLARGLRAHTSSADDPGKFSVSFPVELDLAVMLPPLSWQSCIHPVYLADHLYVVTARAEESSH